jgi:hypothetical protein
MSIERFEANNPEFRFLVEVFPDGKDSIKANDFYQSYREWCSSNQHHPKSNVKFASIIKTLGCKRSNKIGGCFYYTIPRMSTFDIPSHLGIVKRQLGDSKRDSSNLDSVSNRDSCRQFESQNQKDIEQVPIKPEVEYVESMPPKPSTTIPNRFSVRDIAILPPSPAILPPSPAISVPSKEPLKIGDRVVWMDAKITPALKGGVWLVKEIIGDSANIYRVDNQELTQIVELHKLQKAI